MDTKPFWLSKTLWVNLLAAIALIVQGINGSWVFSLEMQALALTIINMVLRSVSKQPIDWR
jgi:hypothetical protein